MHRPNTHITRGKAARNILLAFLTYIGILTVLCTGAYLEAHSTVILPMAYELIEEAEEGEEDGEPEAPEGAVEGTDSGVGCVDDCLDPAEEEEAEKITLI